MINKFLTILLALGLSALPLAGCSAPESEPEPEAVQTTPPPAVDESSQGLLEYEWQLEAFGKLGEEDEILAGAPITLTFKGDGSLSGHGGCNRFSTTFRTGPSDEITVRAFAKTQMECDEATTQQENAYLEALADVNTFDVGAARLQLFYGESEYALVFKGGPLKDDKIGD
jgi:heat shock protein HslJ